MSNNTNKTANRREGKDNIVKVKPRRSIKKKNLGLGFQPVSLKQCNYAISANGTELVRLDFQHLDTNVMETFNFINGSTALDAIMDVLDETGELDIEFEDYIGTKMKVEIVESGRFRNIKNAEFLDDTEEEMEENIDKEEYYEEDDNIQEVIDDIMSDDGEED